jgi:flagellar basal-body rod protein FlgC
MLRTLDISTSGLMAQRERMNTISGNIANINTTRDEQGKPSAFQRRLITFSPEKVPGGDPAGGVGVSFEVGVDPSAQPRLVYQPGHPDANAEGNVAFPGISLTTEFVNAVEASRAYEANMGAIDITKGILSETLKILA